MGGESRPAPTVETITAQPPAFALPGLELASEEAIRQFQAPGPEFFPGSTVVPFAPETEQALQLTTQRALGGSPLVGAAQQTALETIQGRGVNPFLAGAVQAATAPLFEQFQEQTLPGLRSSFAGIGRTGSGAEQRAIQQATREFGRGAQEQAARLAFGSAEAEAARQQAALGGAPGLAQADFTGIQQLAGVGATREDLARQQLQEDISRFQFGQDIEGQRLNQLIAQVTGAIPAGAGVTRGVAQAPGTSRFLSGLGGAASGVATGGQVGSIFGPGGSAIGAGLGGLLGGVGGFL